MCTPFSSDYVAESDENLHRQSIEGLCPDHAKASFANNRIINDHGMCSRCGSSVKCCHNRAESYPILTPNISRENFPKCNFLDYPGKSCANNKHDFPESSYIPNIAKNRHCPYQANDNNPDTENVDKICFCGQRHEHDEDKLVKQPKHLKYCHRKNSNTKLSSNCNYDRPKPYEKPTSCLPKYQYESVKSCLYIDDDPSKHMISSYAQEYSDPIKKFWKKECAQRRQYYDLNPKSSKIKCKYEINKLGQGQSQEVKFSEYAKNKSHNHKLPATKTNPCPEQCSSYNKKHFDNKINCENYPKPILRCNHYKNVTGCRKLDDIHRCPNNPNKNPLGCGLHSCSCSSMHHNCTSKRPIPTSSIYSDNISMNRNCQIPNKKIPPTYCKVSPSLFSTPVPAPTLRFNSNNCGGNMMGSSIHHTSYSLCDTIPNDCPYRQNIQNPCQKTYTKTNKPELYIFEVQKLKDNNIKYQKTNIGNDNQCQQQSQAIYNNTKPYQECLLCTNCGNAINQPPLRIQEVQPQPNLELCQCCSSKYINNDDFCQNNPVLNNHCAQTIRTNQTPRPLCNRCERTLYGNFCTDCILRKKMMEVDLLRQ